MEMIITVAIMTFLFYHMIRHFTPMILKKLAIKKPSGAAGLAGALVHFGYGLLVGGVTGHLAAVYASLPVLIVVWFLAKYIWPEEVANNVGWIERNVVVPFKAKFHKRARPAEEVA